MTDRNQNLGIFMKTIVVMLLFAAATVRAQTATNLFPATNFPAGNGAWQNLAVVPGGIDQYSTDYTLFCNVRVAIPRTEIVAYGDGIHDDTTALNSAFNSPLTAS